MYKRPPHLPEFESPPIVEVVFSVQFEPLGSLRTAQIGLLWERFRKDFPKVDEKPPLEPVLERFDRPQSVKVGLRFEALDVPPLARVLFLNEPESQLIQVQPDRFIHNWRKNADTEVLGLPYHTRCVRATVTENRQKRGGDSSAASVDQWIKSNTTINGQLVNRQQKK